MIRRLVPAIALVAAGSGFLLAVESVRPVPAIPFWAMAYRQFMLVMLSEVALFTLFVLAGVYFRKRPRIHKAMMLLASLSILAGATVRIPMLFPVFGEAGWPGIFGPIRDTLLNRGDYYMHLADSNPTWRLKGKVAAV